MKIRSKQDLKSLIKECLVELLTEGLGGQLVESVRAPTKVQQQKRLNVTPQQQLHKPRQTPALLSAINEAAGSDDVMKDIFADTARTTLPTMLNEGRIPAQATDGTIEGQVVANHEPSDIFGADNVDKWAALAFNSHKKV